MCSLPLVVSIICKSIDSIQDSILLARQLHAGGNCTVRLYYNRDYDTQLIRDQAFDQAAYKNYEVLIGQLMKQGGCILESNYAIGKLQIAVMQAKVQAYALSMHKACTYDAVIIAANILAIPRPHQFIECNYSDLLTLNVQLLKSAKDKCALMTFESPGLMLLERVTPSFVASKEFLRHYTELTGKQFDSWLQFGFACVAPGSDRVVIQTLYDIMHELDRYKVTVNPWFKENKGLILRVKLYPAYGHPNIQTEQPVLALEIKL